MKFPIFYTPLDENDRLTLAESHPDPRMRPSTHLKELERMAAGQQAKPSRSGHQPAPVPTSGNSLVGGTVGDKLRKRYQGSR